MKWKCNDVTTNIAGAMAQTYMQQVLPSYAAVQLSTKREQKHRNECRTNFCCSQCNKTVKNIIFRTTRPRRSTIMRYAVSWKHMHMNIHVLSFLAPNDSGIGQRAILPRDSCDTDTCCWEVCLFLFWTNIKYGSVQEVSNIFKTWYRFSTCVPRAKR
jgi:hypothetical protein